MPWDWIVDETRLLDDFTGFTSIREGALAYLPAIRLDPWDKAAPLILTESRSLAGVLRAMCRDYAVRIASTNGQCAGFLHTDIKPLVIDGDVVLYLGDYDLAGNDIEANTRRVLERDGAMPLAWERLALTAAQAQDLPRITKGDRRRKDGGWHEAVETEALSQTTIVGIVRDRLDALLPVPLAEARAGGAANPAAAGAVSLEAGHHALLAPGSPGRRPPDRRKTSHSRPAHAFFQAWG